VSRYLLDTDTFTHHLRHNPAVVAALVRHFTDHVAVSIITVQELWNGWAAVIAKARTHEQTGTAYGRLTETMNELQNWPIVGFPPAAVSRYAALKKGKLNVGSSDLKIAAIALELGAIVVTRNRRDFERIQGLPVEDWVNT
jgi:tRNA(fMet)-specific endonuclease VapC